MTWINIRQAALLLSGEGRTVHPTTVLYAINVGVLPHRIINGVPVLSKEEIDAKVLSGYRLPLLSELIKKDLKANKTWDKAWDETWEDSEPPMSEAEFEEYERRRIARLAFKTAQKTLWEEDDMP